MMKRAAWLNVGRGVVFCFGLHYAAAACGAPQIDVMPYPSTIAMQSGQMMLTRDLSVNVDGPVSARVDLAVQRLLARINNRTGLFLRSHLVTRSNPDAPVRIHFRKRARLMLGEDESYTLHIDADHVDIESPTDLGSLHAVESLAQLLTANDGGYCFPALRIDDQPRFAWRGLMLDVARHFLPIDVIERNIDAMVAVKLNVLHLHLTDNQGFRVESKTYPKLGPASGEYFTQQQIRDLVAYADLRGIRVVPEFDLPAHATALLAAYPELASKPREYVPERMFGIFDPVIDPTKERTYRFLSRLLDDMLPLFPDVYVHIGGDENRDGADWTGNRSIQRFMQSHGLKDNHDLQGYFSRRMSDLIRHKGKVMMGWEEVMAGDPPASTVVQVWLGREGLRKAAQAGYPTLMSDGYYIDLLHTAKDHYLADPVLPDGAAWNAETVQHVIGGEATMWSELVSPQNIDSRTWPRTAAIAERFWSPATVRDVDDMYRRLDVISARLDEIGIAHLTSRAVLLRNLTGGDADTRALQGLVDVIEPLKDYRRNEGDVMYDVNSPFTLLADAAAADAHDARVFNQAARRFVDDHNARDRALLFSMMETWIKNDPIIQQQAKKSPVMHDAAVLSARLDAVAALVLARLQAGQHGEMVDDSEATKLFDEARQQSGRTTLEVVDALALLAGLPRQSIPGAKLTSQ